MTPEVHKNNEVPAVKPAEAAKLAAGAKPAATAAPGVKPAAGDNPAPTAKMPAAAAKPTPAKKPTAASKRTWKSKVLVGGLAAVVLLGGGIFVGTTLPDPSKSDAYASLAAEKSTVEQDLENSRSSFRKLDEKYAALSGTMKSREDKVTERETALAGAETKVAEAEAAVKKREEAVTGAEAQKAKNTFGDGTRTVGRDIEPGTYITAADVGSSCYWAILTSGTNGSDIVDNDIPGGGRPSVTISEGQDFKSSRCGSWTKQ